MRKSKIDQIISRKLFSEELEKRQKWGMEVTQKRMAKGKSVIRLAKDAGVSVEAIQRIEAGKVDPDLLREKIERGLNKERWVVVE